MFVPGEKNLYCKFACLPRSLSQLVPMGSGSLWLGKIHMKGHWHSTGWSPSHNLFQKQTSHFVLLNVYSDTNLRLYKNSPHEETINESCIKTLLPYYNLLFYIWNNSHASWNKQKNQKNEKPAIFFAGLNVLVQKNFKSFFVTAQHHFNKPLIHQ